MFYCTVNGKKWHSNDCDDTNEQKGQKRQNGQMEINNQINHQVIYRR